jgi:hypothetical protein
MESVYVVVCICYKNIAGNGGKRTQNIIASSTEDCAFDFIPDLPLKAI